MQWFLNFVGLSFFYILRIKKIFEILNWRINAHIWKIMGFKFYETQKDPLK